PLRWEAAAAAATLLAASGIAFIAERAGAPARGPELANRPGRSATPSIPAMMPTNSRGVPIRVRNRAVSLAPGDEDRWRTIESAGSRRRGSAGLSWERRRPAGMPGRHRGGTPAVAGRDRGERI